jgi:hypothetical protein
MTIRNDAPPVACPNSEELYAFHVGRLSASALAVIAEPKE